jgi:peptide deformylase
VIHPIRIYGDPVLRRRAADVTRFDDALARLAADMIETMYAADGVGLAAPQIGLGMRLFVALEVARDADGDGVEDEHTGQLRAAPPDGGDTSSAHPAAEAAPGRDASAAAPSGVAAGDADPAQKRAAWGVRREHVMVNPRIVAREGEQYGPDGCLSLPGLWVERVRRDHRIHIRYQDVGGGRHELAAEGYFAHVLQHENDHLDGVLFFDRLPDAERKVFLEEHRSDLARMQRDAKAFLKELRQAAGRGGAVAAGGRALAE